MRWASFFQPEGTFVYCSFCDMQIIRRSETDLERLELLAFLISLV